MIAAAAMCKCGLRMIVTAGWAHCEHCDRDCPASRQHARCGRCDRLDKA